MSGQVAEFGAAKLLNLFTGEANPVVSGTAPSSWIPGQFWINSAASYAVYVYNGTTPYNTADWAAVGSQYLALLTADPATSGSGGGPSVVHLRPGRGHHVRLCPAVGHLEPDHPVQCDPAASPGK